MLRGFKHDEPHRAPVFMVALTFPATPLPEWHGVVAGVPLARKAADVLVLLGRDYLRRGRFAYDGRRAALDIEMDD